jgi:hypothetical protein
MSRPEFEAIGGTVTQLRRDPPETRWLAELPHLGTVIRRRGPSAAVAIQGVITVRDSA